MLLHNATASDLSGNRTRVYAVRGRRLDRLTNRPESRRQDSNLRPLRPERSALPNWATPRLDYVRKYNIDLWKCQLLFLIFFYFLHFFYIIYIFYSSSHFQSVTHAWRIKFSKRYLQKSFLFEQNSVIISKRELIASAHLNREVPLL